MSATPSRTTITAICWALLAHPAGLVGQDSVSARHMVQVVTGDPTQAGHFVVRITFPAGSHTDPHHHSIDLTERVLEGRLMMGSSARFDTTRVVAFERGSTTVVRATQIHYDWWPEGGELEIEGDGPMETVMVDSSGKALPTR